MELNSKAGEHRGREYLKQTAAAAFGCFPATLKAIERDSGPIRTLRLTA